MNYNKEFNMAIIQEIELLNLIGYTTKLDNNNYISFPILIINNKNKKCGKINCYETKNHNLVLKTNITDEDKTISIVTDIEYNFSKIIKKIILQEGNTDYYITYQTINGNEAVIQIKSNLIETSFTVNKDTGFKFLVNKLSGQNIIEELIHYDINNNNYIHHKWVHTNKDGNFILESVSKLTLRENNTNINYPCTEVIKERYTINDSRPLKLIYNKEGTISDVLNHKQEEKRYLYKAMNDINRIWPQIANYMIRNILSEKQVSIIIKTTDTKHKSFVRALRK
jgi:hypothetical protein